MAHGLENLATDMVYNAQGGTPWHKGGIAVDRPLTLDELRAIPSVNYQVDMIRLAIPNTDGDGNTTYTPADWYGLQRRDNRKMLSYVSPEYNCVQNLDAVAKVVERYVIDGKGYIETAGAPYGGRKFWCAIRVDQLDLYLPGDDQVKAYIVVGNSFNQAESLSVFNTTVRTVCMNTYNAGEREVGNRLIRIRHDGDVLARLESALPEMGFFQKTMARFNEAALAMAKRGISQAEAIEYARSLYPNTEPGPEAPAEPTMTGDPVEDMRRRLQYQASVEAWEAERQAHANKLSPDAAKVIELIETQPGAHLSPGTVWSLFNAVTHYNDHVLYRRGLDSRVNNVLLNGEGVRIKRRAFNQAVALLTP